VPGRPGSDDDWGGLPLLVDTSAWARAASPVVRARWQRVLLAQQLRLLPLVRFEILFSARGGDAFDTLAEQLSAVQPAPLTASVIRAAEGAMRTLAHRSSASHRLPLVDYFVAASAQELGAAVIHYDRDYDTLAEVLEFESVWLAPAGALD
jgi:predicted nucleic acid-binding protein